MRPFLFLALAGALVVCALSLAPPRRAAAATAAPAGPVLRIQAQDAAPGSQAVPASDDDNRVEVMWVAFGLAAASAVVLTLGYLLRAQLGLVKPPPPQPDHDTHH